MSQRVVLVKIMSRRHYLPLCTVVGQLNSGLLYQCVCVLNNEARFCYSKDNTDSCENMYCKVWCTLFSQKQTWQQEKVVESE